MAERTPRPNLRSELRIELAIEIAGLATDVLAKERGFTVWAESGPLAKEGLMTEEA